MASVAEFFKAFFGYWLRGSGYRADFDAVNNERKEIIEELRADIRELKEEARRCREDRDTLHVEVAKLRSDRDRLQGEVDRLRKHLNQLDERIIDD